jgi:peroxiredoxin
MERRGPSSLHPNTFSKATMNRFILLLGVSLLVLIGIYVIRAQRSVPTSSTPLAVLPVTGQWQDGGRTPAADFALPTMAGDTLRLSDLRGKVVVLNFWATWCPPCREEVPDFIALQDELRDRDVVFVGVSVDEDGFAAVRPFAEAFGINYPLVIDDGTVSPQYEGITGLPTTYLINRRGEIEHYMPGALSEAALRPALVALLDERAS